MNAAGVFVASPTVLSKVIQFGEIKRRHTCKQERQLCALRGEAAGTTLKVKCKI